MTITLQRTSVKGEITEGHLRIDGLTFCDTLENTHSCLAPGVCRVHLHKCRQYARKMILVSPSLCSSCPRRHCVNHNTVMPRFCPMLKPGNGIHGRHDGSILVGHRHCQGLLIHPCEVFDTLYDRLRRAIQRGNEVNLHIEDCH